MKFLRSLLATLTGLTIFTGLGILILIIVASVGEEKVRVKDNSVLTIKLNKQIVEREKDDPLAELFDTNSSHIGLIELRRALGHAKTDDKIKGIYLDASGFRSGMSQAEDIREALANFKESGKFVLAYGQNYTEGGYYVASISDEIYVGKDWGGIEFNGLATNTPYFAKTFEKLEIEPVIFKVGTYKSAIEPFTRTNMSDADRQQTEYLIGGLYGKI